MIYAIGDGSSWEFTEAEGGETALLGGGENALKPFGLHVDPLGVVRDIMRGDDEHLATLGGTADTGKDVLDIGMVARPRAVSSACAWLVPWLGKKARSVAAFASACILPRS